MVNVTCKTSVSSELDAPIVTGDVCRRTKDETAASKLERNHKIIGWLHKQTHMNEQMTNLSLGRPCCRWRLALRRLDSTVSSSFSSSLQGSDASCSVVEVNREDAASSNTIYKREDKKKFSSSNVKNLFSQKIFLSFLCRN